jgi:hypothetical protein
MNTNALFAILSFLLSCNTMDCVGACVLPQVTKAGGIRKSFNLSLDTTANSTTTNTASSNVGNTPNIKDNTTSSSSQGIAGVDLISTDSTLANSNTAIAAGITTTADTAAGTAGTEYSDVQQFDGVMPTSESFQYVRPPELELDKYVNNTKTTTESTGTYILHNNCVQTVTFNQTQRLSYLLAFALMHGQRVSVVSVCV